MTAGSCRTHADEHRPGAVVAPLLRSEVAPQQREQRRLVDGVEVVPDVHLQRKRRPALFARDLPHHGAQPGDSGVRAAPWPARIGVRDERSFEPGFQQLMEEVVDDPIPEGGGVDLAGLRTTGDEGDAGLRLVAAFREPPRQPEHLLTPPAPKGDGVQAAALPAQARLGRPVHRLRTAPALRVQAAGSGLHPIRTHRTHRTLLLLLTLFVLTLPLLKLTFQALP